MTRSSVPFGLVERGRGTFTDFRAPVLFAGKSLVLTTAEGLRIGAVSGDRLDATALPSQASATPAGLASLSTSLDILLTYSFPPLITLHSTTASTSPALSASSFAPLLEVVKRTRPRYHFAAESGTFWEREPFSWPVVDEGGKEGAMASAAGGQRVARFLSLGALGGKGKERWFYAFNITAEKPGSAPPAIPSPANLTQNPYLTPLPGASSGHVGFGSDSARNGSNLPGAVQQGNRGQKRQREAPLAAQEDAFAVEGGGGENYIFAALAPGGQVPRDGGRGGKRQRGEGGARGPPPDSYVCRICNNAGHWIQECPESAERDREKRNGGQQHGRGPRPPMKEIGPDECWFCLSNQNFAKHLVVSLSTEVYLTLPRGQIPIPQSSSVPGGGHCLIVPIAHYPTLRSIQDPDVAKSVNGEIDRYKDALKECYKSFGASMVSWEIARTGPDGKVSRGVHAQVQVCPVPNHRATNLEEVFRTAGEKENITFEDDSEAALVKAQEGGNFFKIDLPNGKKLVHLIHSPGFNLQFARTTLANLLGTPNRADWRACAVNEEQEKEEAKEFKGAFKAFEPQ